MTAFPRSLWAETAVPLEDLPPLAGDITTPILVVGGGFTGLSTALHLAERGVESVVIDAAQPGWGASGRNGGQVIPGLKHDPALLMELFGEAAGERLVRFAGAAPDLLFGIVERYKLDCEAVRVGWIQPAHAPEGLTTIRRRAEQWRPFGAEIVELDTAETARLIGSSHYVGAMLDRRGGSVQPLSFARGMAEAAMAQGAHIYGGTPATGLVRTTAGWEVTTPGGKIRAERVVLATNGYTDALHPGLKRSVVPVHSFQVATRPLDHNEIASIFPEGHCASDTRRLLWYFRRDAAGRLLMGGRGFAKTQPEAQDTEVLQEALKTLYPQLGDIRFDYHWGGRVAMTTDHLPHLHELEPGLYAGLGYNGRGVAMATAMGSVLARLAGVGESAETLPFPVTGMKRIPFHAFHSPGVHALTAYYRYLDNKERKALA